MSPCWPLKESPSTCKDFQGKSPGTGLVSSIKEMNDNLRWKHRLQHLNKAFSRLSHACALPEYNELEWQGWCRLTNGRLSCARKR